MKISRIKLDNIQQFKNLEIDLTYPKGHIKAGQPLDKVCFIGQSGTGKTTLLNIIKAVGRTNIGDSWNEMPDSVYLTKDSSFEIEHAHKTFTYTSFLGSTSQDKDFWYKKAIKWKNYKVGKKKFDNSTGAFYLEFDKVDRDIYPVPWRRTSRRRHARSGPGGF